jgi:F0F1-type ATP synthase epsilon subunit
MRTFKLFIMTPEQSLFNGEARYCGITTDAGSIGFEAMHEPMIAILKKNTEIRVKDAAGSSSIITVSEGMLSFRSNTCSITATIQK